MDDKSKYEPENFIYILNEKKNIFLFLLCHLENVIFSEKRQLCAHIFLNEHKAEILRLINLKLEEHFLDCILHYN